MTDAGPCQTEGSRPKRGLEPIVPAAVDRAHAPARGKAARFRHRIGRVWVALAQSPDRLRPLHALAVIPLLQYDGFLGPRNSAIRFAAIRPGPSLQNRGL